MYVIYPYNILASQCKLFQMQAASNSTIQYETTNEYTLSFLEFSQSTKLVDYLIAVFLANYERAEVTPINADNTEWGIGFFKISTLPNSIQIVQYLYITLDSNYACINNV